MKQSSFFTTPDGTKLHYIDEGTGHPLLLIHGWSQSAELFRYQIDYFKAHYRVIALDFRGHGLSEKVEYGYSIDQLTQDLADFFNYLKLDTVHVLSHSMGCAVIWNYWKKLKGKSISKLVLIDQEPCMVINPNWNETELKAIGASMSADIVPQVIDALKGPNGEDFSKRFVHSRFTANTGVSTLEWVVSENLKLPRLYAAELLENHLMQDWRKAISKINVPTLVVSGEAGKPTESQEWICSQIPDARLEYFSAEEGGGHFMFIENPAKFNRAVHDFLMN